MKTTVIKLLQHLNLILVFLYNLSRRRVSYKGLKFLLSHELLKFILTFKEIDFFSITTVIDGGANRGHFSRLLLSVNPSISIHAFEPLATKIFDDSANSCYANLEKLKNRFENFHYSSYALSDAETKQIFNVTSFDECSSLLTPPTQVGVTNSFDVVKSFEVQCTTLQKFSSENNISKIDLIKLDLQGAELKALKGAGVLLNTCSFIFSELNLNRIYKDSASISEVTEYLAEHDFIFTDIKKTIKTSDGSIAQVDGLFQHKVMKR